MPVAPVVAGCLGLLEPVEHELDRAGEQQTGPAAGHLADLVLRQRRPERLQQPQDATVAQQHQPQKEPGRTRDR